jgi:O-antigen/teichoic acid export membrane protein
VKEELRKTFGHAGIYTVGVILSRAASFLMLPIYTRYLTPENYGVLELLELTVDVVSIVVGVGILNGFSKFYYDCTTEDEQKTLVSTIFLLVGSCYFLGSFLGATASDSLSNILFGSDQYSRLVLISFANLFFMILFHINAYYLRTQQKSKTFVVITSLDLVLKISLNLLFVVVFGMGVLGVLVSTLISFALISTFMTIHTFSRIGFRFSRDVAFRLMRFGAPFILSGLAAFINTYADRYFLKHYGDLASVGLYSLGYKFGFLLMVFPVKPLMNIWLVQRFELIRKDGYEDVFNRVLTWFCVITLSVALFVAMIVRDVLRIMSAPPFWSAWSIVPVILLAYFFQACTDFFNFGIYQSEKTRHVAYGTVAAAATTVVMAFLLIPRFGGQGAAWATLIAFAVRMVYFYVASQKLFPVRYELRKPLICTVLSITVYLLYSFGTMAFPALGEKYVSSIVSLVFMGLFGGLLILLNVVTVEERKTIFQFVRYPSRSFREIRGMTS